MALRMTGMMSGLDTETIIQQLVAAKQTTIDTKVKEQTTLQWQQEAWKTLNTKLKSFQSKYLMNMRFSSAYTKKVTNVSNSNAVSVLTGDNAVNGTQTLKVDQLAKTGYLTGKKIGENLTATSTLKDILGDDADSFNGGTISVKAGSKSAEINVTADTSISDVLTQLKSVGLNASFDATQQRFFISSAASGAASDFSITADNAGGTTVLSALGLQTKDLSATDLAEYQKWANMSDDDRDALINSDIQSQTKSYLARYETLLSSKAAAQAKIDEIKAKYTDNGKAVPTKSVEDYDQEIKNLNDQLNAENSPLTDDDRAAIEAKIKDLTAERDDVSAIAAQEKNIASYTDELAKIAGGVDSEGNTVAGYITISQTQVFDEDGNAVMDEDGNPTYTNTAVATTKLTDEITDKYQDKIDYAQNVLSQYDANGVGTGNEDDFATKIDGQDAIIHLNGAKFTNSSNTFDINGLTITAMVASDEEITLTTQQDTDGIYDLIKNFLKEYNELVNEMDKLYNADSAKGYTPLTSEEKDSMTDTEIEEWETKIKDALLRRDSNLSTVNSALQSIMSTGIEVNGKKMFLFDFGIDTLGYFNSSDNEKHAYHIDGDPDDEFTSGNVDKLKTWITKDPDTVISFFTQLSQSLYTKMTDLSGSIQGYRTWGNFYDDKKMQSDYDDYTTKIKELEDKLADYEDKWYAKFSAMETALAKLQSNVNAVTSLLGG